jgi:hypothetical protein
MTAAAGVGVEARLPNAALVAEVAVEHLSALKIQDLFLGSQRPDGAAVLTYRWDGLSALYHSRAVLIAAS